MCQASVTPQTDAQHKQAGFTMSQVAAAMCNAFEHGSVSRALADNLSKLLGPGLTSASIQLPLSEQFLVSRCNFLAAHKDLALTVLPNKPTLSAWASAAPVSARRATSQSLLDVHSMAAASSVLSHPYITSVPLLWHTRWQQLAALLADDQQASDGYSARLCDAWQCAALQAAFPCIGTLTIVCDRPAANPLTQLSTLTQLALTLAPQLLYAAQHCLWDTAVAVGVVPQYPHTFEYCPGEGFVPLEMDDYSVPYDEEDEDDSTTMWAPVDEGQPSTTKGTSKKTHTRCNQQGPSPRRDDDDLCGAQLAASAPSSTSPPSSKAKRMARITSTLHTIPEQHTASSVSSSSIPNQQILPISPPDNNSKKHHEEMSSEGKSLTAPHVITTAQDLQQGLLLQFHSRLTEWHYQVHQSSMRVRSDCVLLALLVLCFVASLGQSLPAIVLGNVVAVGTLMLFACPSVLIHVRDEAFLWLALQQLMHVDWLQTNASAETFNMLLTLCLNALSMAGLLQVCFFKQVRMFPLLLVVYIVVHAASLVQLGHRGWNVLLNPLTCKVMTCSAVTFILEQASRARFARRVINQSLPLTPSMLGGGSMLFRREAL